MTLPGTCPALGTYTAAGTCTALTTRAAVRSPDRSLVFPGLDPETEPEATWPFLFGTDLASPDVCIRMAKGFEVVACDGCGRPFPVAGATGYLDSRPICDRCLLEREAGLGMLLALLAVTRSYGMSRFEDRRHEWAAAAELLAFARVFESFAARFGPPRPFDPRDFTGG